MKRLILLIVIIFIVALAMPSLSNEKMTLNLTPVDYVPEFEDDAHAELPRGSN